MKASEEIRRWCAVSACMAMFWTGLLCAAARAQEPSDSGATNSDQPSTNGKKSGDRPTVKLRIRVRGDNDKPVSNASVYVRYTVPAGLIHNERLAELDLKTNGEGSARVPAVPQGKILIQVIAPGWHTYGKWYDIVDKDEESIEIKLEPPHRWY